MNCRRLTAMSVVLSRHLIAASVLMSHRAQTRVIQASRKKLREVEPREPGVTQARDIPLASVRFLLFHAEHVEGSDLHRVEVLKSLANEPRSQRDEDSSHVEGPVAKRQSALAKEARGGPDLDGK